MHQLFRSTLAAAALLAGGAMLGAPLAAQQPGGTFEWYVGGHGGAFLFRTPTQGHEAMPTVGGHALITARRTGLLLSVEHGFGSTQTSAYSDVNGNQPVTFSDVRKYSAVLMAFPIRAAVQPFLGVGVGIMHVVNPRPVNAWAFQSDAEELGNTGFGTLVGGLQFRLGRFVGFGQYQITTGQAVDVVTDETGAAVAVGRLLQGPTHTFSGGLRFSLGGAREGFSDRHK